MTHADRQHAAPGPTSGSGARGKILLVEDNREVGRATERILTGAGYQTSTAESAEDGLRLAAQNRPDLVLLDLVLPGLDGLTACRRIKSNPALATTLVVIYSASRADEASISAGYDAGADGYLQRPIGNTELLARLRGFFRLKETLDRLKVVERLQKSEIREEMLALAQLGRGATPVSSRVLGITPLRESSPELFAGFVRTYGETVDRRVHQLPEIAESSLRNLAGRLFGVLASPRDVADLHYVALSQRDPDGHSVESRGRLAVGRMALVELLGNLAAAYRNHHIAVLATVSGDRPPPPVPA
jgi:DNA-binding response OmpR family regulator